MEDVILGLIDRKLSEASLVVAVVVVFAYLLYRVVSASNSSNISSVASLLQLLSSMVNKVSDTLDKITLVLGELRVVAFRIDDNIEENRKIAVEGLKELNRRIDSNDQRITELYVILRERNSEAPTKPN